MEKKSYLCSMEIWKDIKGYEGLYQVSNYGRVKRNKILKQFTNSNGWYYGVALSKHSVVKQVNVHRLVAEAFLPNPNNYPLVMHLDNNGLNNNVSNLQWGTHKMNNIQPVIEGRAANQYGKYGKRTRLR